MPTKIFLTGPSGSGKTFIANKIKNSISSRQCVIIDGDELRSTINQDLTFSYDDIKENIRRCGELSNWIEQFIDQDAIIILSIICSYKDLRKILREKYHFTEFFIDRPQCYEIDGKCFYKSKTYAAGNYERDDKNCIVIDNSNNFSNKLSKLILGEHA